MGETCRLSVDPDGTLHVYWENGESAGIFKAEQTIAEMTEYLGFKSFPIAEDENYIPTKEEHAAEARNMMPDRYVSPDGIEVEYREFEDDFGLADAIINGPNGPKCEIAVIVPMGLKCRMGRIRRLANNMGKLHGLPKIRRRDLYDSEADFICSNSAYYWMF